MNDADIVRLYFERSERAIEETDRKYSGYLYSVAYRILCDEEDSRESVNDTYLDAWNSMPPHNPSVLSTFLGKITRRIATDRYRRRSALKRGGGQMPLVLGELEQCIGEDSTEKYVEKIALRALLGRFVESLTQTEREVFMLRFWHVESVEAIADRLGFSDSKVKSILHRVRKKLKKKLEEEGMI